MKVVIMAGGKGTRIASVNSDVPKPMIPIDGKPILEYQINALAAQGYCEIILIIGHLGHVIRDYFEDGSKWNVQISYIEENILPHCKHTVGNCGSTFLFEGTNKG